jgi:Protein of unknown function (DUF732)
MVELADTACHGTRGAGRRRMGAATEPVRVLTLRSVSGAWRLWARGGAVLFSVVAVGLLGTGCSSGSRAANTAADSTFLSSVHLAAPDVSQFRTDVQLERLGHAACDGFRGGASYQQLADRMSLQEGNPPLPSQDLGAVITAAVQSYCPQFQKLVS